MISKLNFWFRFSKVIIFFKSFFRISTAVTMVER